MYMKTQDRTIRDVIKDLSDWMEKIDRIESHGYPDRNNEYFEESLYTLVEELLNQPEKKCIGCNPELAGKDGGSPGHTCEATPGTALVEKQNKTIIFEIKINGEFNKIISDISLINGVESVQDITEEISVALKQPEKQYRDMRDIIDDFFTNLRYGKESGVKVYTDSNGREYQITLKQPEKQYGGGGATREQIIEAETKYITGVKQEIEIAEELYSVREFIYHLMEYNEDVDKKKYTKSQIATNIAKAMLNFFDETDVSY